MIVTLQGNVVLPLAGGLVLKPGRNDVSVDDAMVTQLKKWEALGVLSLESAPKAAPVSSESEPAEVKPKRKARRKRKSEEG